MITVTCPECSEDREVQRAHGRNVCAPCARKTRYPKSEHPETVTVECPECHTERELKWVGQARTEEAATRPCRKCTLANMDPSGLLRARAIRAEAAKHDIEEIEWLLSFRMHPSQIARRLGRTVAGIEQLLRRTGHPAQGAFTAARDAQRRAEQNQRVSA